MGNEQRKILFSGTVQGVGFRFTAVTAARRYDVTGYVRNLADGRVECLVEGPSGQIDSFLSELSDRMGGYIADRRSESGPSSGKYSDFGVRY